MFVPATEQQSQLADDSRIYDASELSIHQPAADEVRRILTAKKLVLLVKCTTHLNVLCIGE